MEGETYGSSVKTIGSSVKTNGSSVKTNGSSVKTNGSPEDDINHIYLSIGSTFRDLQTTYLIISLVLSVGCGLLLLFLVWKKDYLQKPSHFLRCNLAVDDIIFTSCLIPVRIYAIFQQDINGEDLWSAAKLLVAPPCLLSMFGTYLMMAVDLYYFVCEPLHYHDKVTTKRVVVGIATIRTLSFLFGLAPVVFFGVPQFDQAVNSASSFVIFRNIGLVVFLLVALSIPLLYYQVIKEARRQQERDENRDLWVFQTKAFKMMVPHAIVLTVSVATSIFQVAMARALISDEEQTLPYALIVADHVAILLFLTVSSIANPIIYSFRLPDFRRACKELCGLPTNTPPAVPARRHGDMEMAVITGSGQGAQVTEMTPAPTSAEKFTKEDVHSQNQTTRANTSPGRPPGTKYRGCATSTAYQRPSQFTVRADVHAEPTPCSGQDIAGTLPGQLHLDADSGDVAM
ncbi:trace amine-associated receptor 5-like [Branchiostoma floridae]|uniref:Trace amine-associated receptor 5-like n=1 Tax=Branchiostoma floridae TaxID=7739 RepID=A0A9J7HS23_BRAFL|nr:trace amine-associated receptor 5-like [Branchiostoma floridae]